MSYFKGNRLQLAAIIVLAGLLLTLAMFQYSWLGRLSERERERMQRSLRFATFIVRDEFDRELADIYRRFQFDYTEEGSFAEQLAARYAAWVDEVKVPLIERLFWVTNDEDDGLQIRQFTGFDDVVLLEEWPPEIVHLKHQFEATLRYNEAQFQLLVGPPPLQDDIPALVIQQVATRPPASLPEYESIHWVIAILNRDVIFGELIPQLSEEYISGEESFDYNVGIVKAENPDVLVWPPGRSAASFRDPDAESGMYALRDRHFNLRSRVNNRAWNVVQENAQPRWNLVVKHQAGSLEAAVTVARNRSLAVSLGVLSLLAVSIMMIVVSTRRAQRLAAQQMEFVAGVSHELRTPLAVIRAAAENLADDIVQDPQRTRQYGDLINREGRRLSDMVERVLLFAKIRSGHQAFAFAPLDMAAVINRAVDSNQTMATELSVHIESRVAEELPLTMGDEAALGSALQNLVSNAVKYSNYDGTVHVEAREGTTEDGTEIQIAVRDEGEGIPADEVAHLFEPFFRGKRAKQAQIQGSGLGLSLVKQVIEAHSGEVTIESTPGSGSTFVVHVPVKDIGIEGGIEGGAEAASH